jgi:chemotaxis protein MotA
MDLGSIIGIVLGWLFVIVSIVMGGGAGFINYPSIMITIGGAVSSTLIHYPLPKILSTMGVVRKAFISNESDYVKLFEKLSDIAVRARRDGILALENDIEQMSDPFMKKGFQMAVDGNSTDIIRHVLEEDINSMMSRHIVGQGVFKALANYAPAFGMIGTLIGLVQMLRNMTDPSAIGSGMAVALITTLYGALIANVVALPIAGKLEQRSGEEVAIKNMVLEGILSIQEGNSPRVVQEKLRSFMPPKVRQLTEENERKAKTV